jgi:hypothetical protein
MYPVNISQPTITPYLLQAKAILVVTLGAYQGDLPQICQDAIWAAADLVDRAVRCSEGETAHAAPAEPADGRNSSAA